jgi:hypothetical protein
MTDRDIERLCQFTRTGTKLSLVVDPTAPFHKRNSARWFQCSNEHEPVLLSFDQYIQHPVNAVIQINVSRTGLIALDKSAGAGPDEAVTRFITDRVVGLGLNDHPAASSPNQLAPHQLTRAAQRIMPKKIRANHFAH